MLAMNEPASTPRMMVVSVGGSPAPIVHSLNQQRPEYIVFFASRQTRGKVEAEIRPALAFRPTDVEVLTTDSAERLVPAFTCVREGVRRCMALWGVAGPEVVADYTGGTKNMTTALALATVDLGCRYSYVGGVERTKEGLGVVIDGHEQMFYPANPWDVLGVDALREVTLLFNRARYGPARERLETLGERVPAERRPLYRRLAQVVEGFDRWDRFDHKGAAKSLGQALGKLHEAIGLLDPTSPERRFLDATQAARGRLPEITASHPRAYVADLIANAARRADLEERYEDAVARLYAAIEKLGKLTLKQVHGLDNGRLAPEAVPEPLRADYRLRYWSEEKGHLQLPLRATYDLLAILGDPLGRRVVDGWENVGPLLDQRNQSILGHGTQPISRETYVRLREAALELLGIGGQDLPIFPTWPEG
jgi:CRISPR-associated protein (TIGR02710 family)